MLAVDCAKVFERAPQAVGQPWHAAAHSRQVMTSSCENGFALVAPHVQMTVSVGTPPPVSSVHCYGVQFVFLVDLFLAHLEHLVARAQILHQINLLRVLLF